MKVIALSVEVVAPNGAFHYGVRILIRKSPLTFATEIPTTVLNTLQTSPALDHIDLVGIPLELVRAHEAQPSQSHRHLREPQSNDDAGNHDGAREDRHLHDLVPPCVLIVVDEEELRVADRRGRLVVVG